MAVSKGFLKIAALTVALAAGAMTASAPALARDGGHRGGGGGGGGGAPRASASARPAGNPGGGGFRGFGAASPRGGGNGGFYAGWGNPYPVYVDPDPGYYDAPPVYAAPPVYDDGYDEAPAVVHRYHVIRDHYCRIRRKRVRTSYGWRWRKLRYCTR